MKILLDSQPYSLFSLKEPSLEDISNNQLPTFDAPFLCRFCCVFIKKKGEGQAGVASQKSY
jgi:hypothetical protein